MQSIKHNTFKLESVSSLNSVLHYYFQKNKAGSSDQIDFIAAVFL